MFFDHICGSLLYLLVQNNIDAEIDKKSDREDTILIKSSYRDLEQIIIGKSNGLEKITVLGSKGKSELNFVEKKILLQQEHDRLIFEALANLENGDLRNIKIIKTDGYIELLYER